MHPTPKYKAPQERGLRETVTEKGVCIHIYYTPKRKSAKVYSGYTLVYTAAGRRRREFIAKLEKARARAKQIAAQLGEGIGHAHVLSASQAADTIAAMQAVRALGEDVTLSEVATDYVSAIKLLPADTTLREAVAHYSEYTSTQSRKANTLVSEVVGKFKTAKEAEELSAYYLTPLFRILNRFASAFKCPIGSVEAESIREWITAQKVGKRTRNNLRNSLATLFAFARDQGYLPEDRRTAAERVKAEKIKDTSIGVYTAEELAMILNAAPQRLVAPIAVAAFAGIRSAELLRLEWRHVKLTQRHIELPPEVTKTSSRRVVPIQPALSAWLRLPFIKKSGHVAPPYQNLDNLTRGIVEAVKAAHVTPKRNGFRHSFGTYRLAVTRNAPQTSLEMGNSVAKLMRNYNRAATPAQGKQWFGVMPVKEGKVIDCAFAV